MLNSIATTRFRKDVKLMKRRGKDIEKLIKVINLLIEEKLLPQKYRDHSLKGNYAGRRECHIEPDWLLIYKIEERDLILERTGSHADLFE